MQSYLYSIFKMSDKFKLAVAVGRAVPQTSERSRAAKANRLIFDGCVIK